MINLTQCLMLAALLFGLGIAGILMNRKNLIVMLMSVELILLAVNTNFVAFSAVLNDLPDVPILVYRCFDVDRAAAFDALS